MNRYALALIALAACKHGGGDDYPILPGGDDVSVLPQPDAPAPGDAAVDGVLGDGGGIAGKVCELVDPRAPTACSTSGVAGVTVTLGTASTTTADDGSFTIATPSGVNLVWRASSATRVTSVMAYTTTTTIPIITQEVGQDMIGANGVILNQGEGSAIIYVISATGPVAMATGVVGTGRVFGDGGSPFAWNEDTPTGPAGALWFTNVPAGDVSFTVQPDQGQPQTVTLPIGDGTFTYGVVQL